MPRERRYYVYIVTSSLRRALYTGVTNNIYNRRQGHLTSDASTFAGRYRTFRLVYVEVFRYVNNAIAREKQIKGWTRAKKEALISAANPLWRDLSRDWGQQYRPEIKTQDPSASPQDDKSRKPLLNARILQSGDA